MNVKENVSISLELLPICPNLHISIQDRCAILLPLMVWQKQPEPVEVPVCKLND